MQIISVATKILRAYSRRDIYWYDHETTNVKIAPTEVMFTCSIKLINN